MQRYKLTIEFDGRAYAGMQAQDNAKAVQEVLERAIAAYTQNPAQIGMAGRTDTGVHAKAMVVHCDIGRSDGADKVAAAINAHLRGEAIAVLKAERVPGTFNARFDCIGRSYGYRIIARRSKLTFDRGLAWHIPQQLDVSAMHAGAQHLIGKHDFSTFRTVHCQAKSPIKTLDRLDVVQEGQEIWIYAQARSFLHTQVRSMVGCLSLVGRERWTPEDMRTALEAKDRHALGYNAPPDGLYFLGAKYPEIISEHPKE